MKKIAWVATAQNLQSIKTFSGLILELSKYRKSGNTYSSSEKVAASSDCSRLGNFRSSYAVTECGPKSFVIDFAVKTFDCIILEYPSGVIAKWPAAAQTWTQTLALQPD